MAMPDSGLVHGYLLDGLGSARRVTFAELATLSLTQTQSLWLHWNISHSEASRWLRESSGLSAFACSLLLAENTRPRLVVQPGDGLLVFLRGVNLNPGQVLEDMVSIRVYAEQKRLISLRLRSTNAAQSVITQFEQGIGPKNISELLLALSGSLTDQVDICLDELSDALDSLEDHATQVRPLDHAHMVKLRRRVAGLRRFLAPLRDLYAQLARLSSPWISAAEQSYWAELNNSLVRHLEDLELLRERASMLLEAERSRSSERMNRLLYRFAVITVLFLPMTFFTGLLGINVGGIPWADSPWGFTIACVILLVLVVLQLVLYRRIGWL